MGQRAALPAEISRHAVALARALTVALRSWSFYPPDHPAVGLAVDRLAAAVRDATDLGPMQFAVTPRSLLIDGTALESNDLSVAECAAQLHDRDLLQVAFIAPPPDAVLRTLLAVLSLDRETRRARGGPATVWATDGDTAILLEQIDYQEILERDADLGVARRDSTWKAIVRSIIVGRTSFTTDEQQRLLEVSRDVGAIGELTRDCREPYTTPDGSPLQTTQSAAVLAVYQHIAQTVAVLEPNRTGEVMSSLGLAASALEPGLAFELLGQGVAANREGFDGARGGPGADGPDGRADGGTALDDRAALASTLRQSMDDQQVAMLLARAIATPGHAAGRLSHVLETITPDQERRLRVVRLAQKLMSERDFGRRRPADDIRQSFDELMLKYDESKFVSATYRGAMDEAAAHAIDLLGRGLPAEMAEWLATLGHENVRRLSALLLADLLRNETEATRVAEIAADMGTFVEDLLLAGAFSEALPVIEALVAAEKRQPPLAPAECRTAIDRVGESLAFAEAAAGLDEQTPEEAAHLGRLAVAIGPASVLGLLAAYTREDVGVGGERATAIMARLGPGGLPRLTLAAEDPRWYVQREMARAIGQIGTAAAVPPLQTLVRRSDLRVVQAGVAALSRVDDPAAARALQTLLKATTGEARAAVIAALVGQKDPRVVPMLARILGDSDPFGADHAMVLETVSALASLRDDRAVAALAQLARQKRWRSWGRMRVLRGAALRALVRIGSAKAREALADLARTGDYFLRRRARAAARSVA